MVEELKEELGSGGTIQGTQSSPEELFGKGEDTISGIYCGGGAGYYGGKSGYWNGGGRLWIYK